MPRGSFCAASGHWGLGSPSENRTVTRTGSPRMCAARVSSRARGVAVNVPVRTVPLVCVTRYPGREPRTRATVSVSSWARVISSRVVVMGAPQGVAALRRLKTLAPSHRANNGSAASEPIGVVGGELLERDCGPADDVRDRGRDLARLAPRVVGVVLEQTIDLPRREDAP